MLNKDDIKKIIPHREPMLLVDEVLEIKAERNITAKFYVDPDMPLFEGHFPDEPVLPGVYTVEIMAQTSDILLLSCERYAGKIPLFIGIDKVRFYNKIKPSDELIIRSAIDKENADRAIVSCYVEVFVGDTKMASGIVTLAMR